MKIARFADRTAEFWIAMGPFFASSSVRKDMPYLVDRSGYNWFVATSDTGVVQGFVALDVTAKGASVHGLYVVPEFRSQKIAETLLKGAIKSARADKALPVKATVSPESLALFTKLDFEPVGAAGKFTKVALGS